MPEGVYGTAWEVHGGGFYHVEKYLVAPTTLPPDLIWYKWEAYLTWVTGFGLLIVQYYWQRRRLPDRPAVLPLLPSQAIVISVLSLVGGWLIYDRLCKSPIGRNTTLLAVAVFALIVAAAWSYTHVFSGPRRAHPCRRLHRHDHGGQRLRRHHPEPEEDRRLAARRTRRPTRALGAIGKQRSVHNNYLTLPVLVMMVEQPLSDALRPPADLAGGGADRRDRRLGPPFPQPARRRRPASRRSAGRCRSRRWRSAGADLADRAARDPVDRRRRRSPTARCWRIVGKHCVMCHAAAAEPRRLRRAAQGRHPRPRSPTSSCTRTRSWRRR